MACIRKWRGNLVVDYYDASRKRHRTQVETREEGHRLLAEIEANDRREPIKGTFKEYGKWWLENCAQGNIKESTYEEYERVLKLHLYPALGHRRFTKVTRKMVRELIAAKRNDGLSQSSIRNILAPLRGMCNQAIDDEDAFRNPAARMGKFNKKTSGKPPINPLSREEVQAMLDKAQTDFAHYYPLFLCASRTGLREGELIALKGIDIDFQGRFIDVQRNLSRGKLGTPKNGKTRRVDMSKSLAVVLNELLSRKRAVALRREMEKPAAERRDAAVVVNEVMEDWLFTTPQTAANCDAAKRRRLLGIKPRGGTQLDPSNVRKVFNSLLTAAKSRRIRFHDLRHTFASLLIEQGESLAYIRDQLGHSSIEVTVDTYGHLVPGGNRQAVDKLDERVSTRANQDAAMA
jgi:integrase